MIESRYKLKRKITERVFDVKWDKKNLIIVVAIEEDGIGDCTDRIDVAANEEDDNEVCLNRNNAHYANREMRTHRSFMNCSDIMLYFADTITN